MDAVLVHQVRNISSTFYTEIKRGISVEIGNPAPADAVSTQR